MFGIGFSEILLIAVVALVFVGPKRLPELAKQFGKFFVQMRRMTNEVRSTIETAIHDAELEVDREEREKLKKLLSDTHKDIQEVAIKAMENPLAAPAHSEHHGHHHAVEEQAANTPDEPPATTKNDVIPIG